MSIKLNPSRTRECKNSGLKILSFDSGYPRATTFIIKGKIIDMMLMCDQNQLFELTKRDPKEKVIQQLNLDQGRFQVGGTNDEEVNRIKKWLRDDLQKGALAKGGRGYFAQGDHRGCIVYYPLLQFPPKLLQDRDLTMMTEAFIEANGPQWLSANISTVGYIQSNEFIKNYRCLTSFLFTKMNYTHIQESKFLWILPYPIIDILQTSLHINDEQDICYVVLDKRKWKDLLRNFEFRKYDFGNKDLGDMSEFYLRRRRRNSLSSAIGYAAFNNYISMGGNTYRKLEKYLPEGFDYRSVFR